MLRARRVELGLSQADVAGFVKLPARRIEALEQERWEELPEGPYLRGFLRNVARALNLDVAALIARVDGSLAPASRARVLTSSGTTHVMLPRRSGPADDRRGGRRLVYGAFAFALIAALIAWSGTDSFDRALVAGKAMFGAPHEIAVAPAVPAVPAKADDVAAETAAASPPAAPEEAKPAPAPTATGIAAQSPSPPATALALLFHFNEESWVEVRGADGKVLYQRLNPAGSDQGIDGVAPFSLVVGNAKGVALRFRGQPVDLTPYTRDSVARFTLS